MKKTFTLPLLNLVTLDRETQEILARVEKRKKSEFIREAIVTLAIEQEFKLPDLCPVYVPCHKWQKVQVAKNKNRSVDYSYVIAYFWLKSLPKYTFWLKSEIIREAIKSYYYNEEGKNGAG